MVYSPIEILKNLNPPTFVLHTVDFAKLVEEWKGPPNTKGTQFPEKKVRRKNKKQSLVAWLKPYLISLALFLCSTNDVVSDGILANSFIGGTNYIKNVENQSDPVVENCTLVQSITKLNAQRFYPFVSG